jgi:excisionase family DNA binding protein
LQDIRITPVAKPPASKPSEEPRLALTIRETSHLANLSERTIRTMIHRGDLPYLQVGSKILILRADITAWLQNKRTGVKT